MDNEEITDYMNEFFTEEVIQGYENQLLKVLKVKYEKWPTTENDKEWLEYTNFICRRRCQRHAKIEMDKNLKYKPCCNRRCLLGNCQTREDGGCFCVCSLQDHISTLKGLIEGTRVSPYIFFGDKDIQNDFYEKNKDACDKYINEAPKLLEEAKEKLKKYEI